MTSFGDVNVGDKVRLTHNEFVDLEDAFRVDATREGQLRSAYRGWYDEDAWSVEVLEPAPKPLPTTDGIYALGEVVLSTPLWALDSGCWVSDASGDWLDVDREDVPAGLVRLVPSSAVEEARAEVVKEIVAYARASELSMLSADFIERKFLGGKA